MGFATPPASLLTMAQNAIGTGKLFDDLRLNLYVNNLDPLPTNVTADFTAATFDGYAPVGPLGTWVPYFDGSQNVNIAAPSVLFVCSGTTTPNLVYGYYLTKSTAGGTLIFAEKFEGGPIPINAIGDGVQVFPIVQLQTWLEPLAPQTGE